MSEEPNRDRGPKEISSLVVAGFGLFVGIFAGMLALVRGAHGGELWPTAVLTGPVCLVAQAFGDNLGYVYFLLGGTGIIYGIYGFLVVTRRPTLAIALVVHAISSALILLRG